MCFIHIYNVSRITKKEKYISNREWEKPKCLSHTHPHTKRQFGKEKRFQFYVSIAFFLFQYSFKYTQIQHLSLRSAIARSFLSVSRDYNEKNSEVEG